MTEPIVSIAQGKLQGKVLTNINNGKFYSFQSIPYARPPVGGLRFKSPQPPESWTGIRDATQQPNACYSRHLITKEIVGSEDCLYLNVYTPEISSEKEKLRPVMVWIHGGAFVAGSSRSEDYGPEYLLTEDIVLVTINYRLGILGFLTLEDSSLGIPGNAGMKDMVMALKWVQSNITSFGGNPKNVTIFGESAGAAAVHYLVLSSTAKGLFHKAIAQSGCALNIFARGRNTSHELAKALGLATMNEKEILDLLMSLPVEKLYELSEKVVELCEMMVNPGSKRPYAPVVEKPSEDAFITEEPIKILRSGNYNKVPLFFGYTTREGMLIEIKIKPRKPGMPRDFEALVPFTLGVERGSETSKAVAEKIKQFYYGQPGSENIVDNFYIIHTDLYFFRDIMFSINQHVNTSSTPVYLYRMSVESGLNIYKILGQITAPGVAHGDDIPYLFKTKYIPEPKRGTLEDISVRRFVKIWTNFARIGNPSINEEDTVDWKPVKKGEINFVDIGQQLTPGVNPEPERAKFWNEIFKINPLYLVQE